MNGTGIVRKVDELGRVVIPKELRRKMHIRVGDEMEIFVNDKGEVLLKKHSSLGDLEYFAQTYAESLAEVSEKIICITDRDKVIAVSGAPPKDYQYRVLGTNLETLMEERKTFVINEKDKVAMMRGKEKEMSFEAKFTAFVLAPILVEANPLGMIIIATRKNGEKFGQTEKQLAEAGALYLAKELQS